MGVADDGVSTTRRETSPGQWQIQVLEQAVVQRKTHLRGVDGVDPRDCETDAGTYRAMSVAWQTTWRLLSTSQYSAMWTVSVAVRSGKQY